jgi:hypothetical protein
MWSIIFTCCFNVKRTVKSPFEVSLRRIWFEPCSVASCLRCVEKKEIEGLPSHMLMFLLFHSQHVSAQMGSHQMFHVEYTNDDGICVKTAMLVYIFS